MRRRRNRERKESKGEVERELRALGEVAEGGLNKEQRRAVEVLQKDSLQGDYFLLPTVDGPPGTGKTTTGAAAVIRKLAEEGLDARYLVLCYTHVACCRFKESLEKLGLRPELAVYLKPSLGKPPESDHKKGIVSCDPYLRGFELGEVNWLRERPVLITTLLGVTRALQVLRQRKIRIMIDEFSQVSMADFLMAVGKTRENRPYQYSLLGDPFQLPVVTTQRYLQPNVCQALRESLSSTVTAGTIPVSLRTQYRMHEQICRAINEMRKVLNTHELKTAEEVRGRDLHEMGYRYNPPGDAWMGKVLDPGNPLVLVDTSNLGMEKSGGDKVIFREEARLAAEIAVEASRCYEKDGKPLFPKILTPYNGQKQEIESLLPQNWLEDEEISPTTVHKAQGAEYPMVVVSFVRNNPTQWVGFLEEGRLPTIAYVAVSRAQAKLVVLLSERTFVEGGKPLFKALWNTPGGVRMEARR